MSKHYSSRYGLADRPVPGNPFGEVGTQKFLVICVFDEVTEHRDHLIYWMSFPGIQMPNELKDKS